ncbi:MAG TPA: hypothetical protein VIB78_01675 [Acidimicrobiia bacterium]|jgi:hypothetical protein
MDDVLRHVSVPWTQEQEFAKDVSAFSNHRGGLLIIGITFYLFTP